MNETDNNKDLESNLSNAIFSQQTIGFYLYLKFNPIFKIN